MFTYEKYNLRPLFDIDLLRRGAELSRNHRNFMLRNDLNPIERRALENDYKGKVWPQSTALKTGLLTCCTAAVVQYVMNPQAMKHLGIITVFFGIYLIP